ncbi:MAG: hypothetical protein N3A72_09365 [bacterium]|nr:hypothetical protein [bacterium]
MSFGFAIDVWFLDPNGLTNRLLMYIETYFVTVTRYQQQTLPITATSYAN